MRDKNSCGGARDACNKPYCQDARTYTHTHTHRSCLLLSGALYLRRIRIRAALLAWLPEGATTRARYYTALYTCTHIYMYLAFVVICLLCTCAHALFFDPVVKIDFFPLFFLYFLVMLAIKRALEFRCKRPRDSRV